MNSPTTPTGTEYAAGYARGRHAAKENVPLPENPYRRGSASFHGWHDGHYDERSARRRAIERHSAALWANE